MRHLIPFLAPLALWSAPVRAACPVESLIPEYRAFLARTATASPDDRARQFLAQEVPRHPSFYLVAGAEHPADLALPARTFFAGGVPRPGLRPFDPAMLEGAAAVVERDLPAIQTRFAAAFPDFRCRTTIMIGVSLGRFDGLLVPEGAGRLLFGLDIVSRARTSVTLPVLFDHELFHLYHRQVNPAGAALDPLPVWWMMWSEGLATLVSGQLNPAVPQDALFAQPADLAAQVATDRQGIARMLLAQVDATGDQAARLFAADASIPGYPPRAAYVLGYELARDLGTRSDAATLARMPPAEVRSRVLAFLTRAAA